MRVFDRRRKVGTAGDLSLHGLDDCRVGVPLHHRAESVVEIDHLGAVDVPDLGTVALLQIDRPWVANLVGRRHAAGQAIAAPVRTSRQTWWSERRASFARAP